MDGSLFCYQPDPGWYSPEVNPATEVHLEELEFYVQSISSPALALGHYADRYRKAHESHLMSVCRLCLAVLQRLRVVCHDNEIHNA